VEGGEEVFFGNWVCFLGLGFGVGGGFIGVFFFKVSRRGVELGAGSKLRSAACLKKDEMTAQASRNSTLEAGSRPGSTKFLTFQGDLGGPDRRGYGPRKKGLHEPKADQKGK